MTAQDVIADCLKQLRRPGARTTDAGDAAFVTAALAAAGYVVERGWQPIETAPRTTTARLVWCPERQNIHSVTWWAQENNWAIFGGGGRILMETPTHWRPLPDPPAAEAEAKEASAEQTSLTVPQQRTLDKALRRSVKFVGGAEAEAKESPAC